MATVDNGVKRSQEEIVNRFSKIDGYSDFFGFRRDVLAAALDYAHAKPFLRNDAEVTQEEWESAMFTDLVKEAEEYYEFALGKAKDHRGLSAGRSVQKLTEIAWLLGRDDVVAAMDAAPYSQYGVPKLAEFGMGLGFTWPNDEVLQNMSQGRPCYPGCEGGCDEYAY